LTAEIRVAAKINLWLEVIGKRADGYHDLSSLMLPVGIYDTLVLEFFEGEGIRLECSHPAVPADASNLAWRAAEAFFNAIGVRRGVKILLKKQIPAAGWSRPRVGGAKVNARKHREK